ncbi:CamS family sex pheromone protein [Lactiplantibacillus fabifermentans]|uniref:Lipoprotein n=2 Tax=Lactiplantibacillus fabifermentans TaxID=483011 RepID=A0A0R2NVS0_9LACO|nr:CamS family sex pheromone protein [Lactiplantibacillus fabifermentans]ETY74830.1 calcium-transporting ATPase [Lactiplantibacillus fabifermentans T30PCM01]KRO28416.1 lipoprotein [Lactiplantibacillus fabifermentans DSM 21115]
MNLKRIRTIGLVAVTAIALAACGNLKSSSFGSSSSSTTTTTGSKTTTTTGSTDSEFYQGVIKNGRYRTSKSRGVNVSQNDNVMNLKSFETQLLDVSQKVFSTSKYVFQEGQYLSTSTVENWLGRYSKSNKTGLNPQSNGKTGSTTRNPIYLQQLEEQDYMIQSGSKLSLGGVTVGLGLNSVDYYTKVTYGATYETDISTTTLTAEGKKMANTVLQRMRQKSALKNVPIVLALYKQSSNDSLVGGNMIAYAVSKNGSTSFSSSDWKSLNWQSYVFPATSESKNSGANSNDESDFSSFKSHVQNFFPNLSGVTANAHYQNKSLKKLSVNITTKFYSETEIISFTQYLATAAKRYLPSGVPVEITVKGADGTIQSFLARTAKGSSYYTHVFSDQGDD